MFRQLIDARTHTYTYLLADPKSGEAVIIDPVAEQSERDIRLLQELGLKLRYTLETHVHADHITGSGLLREKLGAKSGMHQRGGAECADLHLKHGDRISFGDRQIEVRATPGHTDGCVSYVVREGDKSMVFTGDALLIRGCGRTDFQAGDSHKLYHSVREQLFSLPEDTVVYPGHDYRGHTRSTIGEEKAHNPRLKLGIDEPTFVAIMAALDLPHPAQMDVAVPANLACGMES